MSTTHEGDEELVNGFGSLLYAPEFNSAPQALSPQAFIAPGAPSSLPSLVTLNNLPPVAMQGTTKQPGSPGSCEAQSFGYGLGSYTAALNTNGAFKWDTSQPASQVSAAFLYNYMHHQEQKDCPKGSLATPYLDYLIANGSPSASDIPYQPNCKYLSGLPLDPDFPGMAQFCLGSFATFNIQKNPAWALFLIKQLLANGLAIAFSGPVLTGYYSPVFSNGIICETTTIPKSGHGQLIVGYDDTIGPPANPGALLIQNSFGTDWPGANSGSAAPGGKAYWSLRQLFRIRCDQPRPAKLAACPKGDSRHDHRRPDKRSSGDRHWFWSVRSYVMFRCSCPLYGNYVGALANNPENVFSEPSVDTMLQPVKSAKRLICVGVSCVCLVL